MQAKVNLLKADIGRSVEAALAVAEAEEWEKTQRALRADDGSGWPMPAEKPAPRKRPDAARVEPRLSALEFQFMELEQEERRRAQEERLRALRGER